MYKPLKRKKGLGGLIGTGVGAVAGTFAGNPMMGAKLGGMAGNMVEGAVSPQEQAVDPNTVYSRGTYSYGMANGGMLPTKGMPKKASGIVGPRHENGGVAINGEVEVEGNETMDTIKGKRYVFSDRLKVPKSNKTFAQRHKELMDQGATRDAVQSLAKMQERVSGRTKQMKKGGKMYQTGGVLPGGPDMSPVPYGDEPLSRFMGPGKKGSVNGGFGIDGNMALQIAPDVINAATGIFSKDKTRPATQVRPTRIQRSYTGYNINPLLSANRSGYRAVVADPNATTNQKLASQMAKTQADQRAFAEKENRDQQAKMRYDMAQGNIDSQANMANARFNEQYRQDRMMSDANRGITGNFARNAYGSIANKFLTSRAEDNLANRDKRMLEMYRSVYGTI